MGVLIALFLARHEEDRRPGSPAARDIETISPAQTTPRPTNLTPFHVYETIAKMATINYRTIDIDALDPDSAANFDISSLAPDVVPISTADVQTLAGQIRQLLRGGDTEGALRGALENVPYGADQQGKVYCTRRALRFSEAVQKNFRQLSMRRF